MHPNPIGRIGFRSELSVLEPPSDPSPPSPIVPETAGPHASGTAESSRHKFSPGGSQIHINGAMISNRKGPSGRETAIPYDPAGFWDRISFGGGV
jgi:hypothetical protein